MFWPRRRRVSRPSQVPSSFDALQEFKDSFEIGGVLALDRCPICDGAEIGRLWQLPQSRLGAPTFLNSPGSAFHDFYLDYLPLLKVPQRVFIFDICRFCHAIFRNPKDDDHTSYATDHSKVAAFKEKGLSPFSGIVSTCEKQWPRGTRFVVDAACGAGQAVALLQQRHPDLRFLGLDLSTPSIQHMKARGLLAEIVDLDFADLDDVVAPGTVDFVLFYEAFEHVRRPLEVLKKLVRMLRSGGRLHFTAQYYGAESTLPVRVGEPIYIDRHCLKWVVSQLGADLKSLVMDTKFRITLQKR